MRLRTMFAVLVAGCAPRREPQRSLPAAVAASPTTSASISTSASTSVVATASVAPPAKSASPVLAPPAKLPPAPVHLPLKVTVFDWLPPNVDDPAVRRVMRAVANDEADHAELAHDVDAWCGRRGIDTRESRDRAVAQLVDEVRRPPAPFRIEAGEPTVASAVSLVESLRAAVWSSEAALVVSKRQPGYTASSLATGGYS